MQWHDVHADEVSAGWRGLVFFPDSALPKRPPLHVEAHTRRIRIQERDQPLLWVRIADDHCDYDYWVSSRSWSAGQGFVAPIRFEAVHETSGLETPARLAHWARYFARAFVSEGRGPISDAPQVLLAAESFLGEGTWTRASRLRAPPAERWSEFPDQQRQDAYAWDFSEEACPLSLVDPMALDEGRVHAWRKFARLGELPPVLLWWVSGLDRYVLLDGAHRAMAAVREGTAPPCFALTSWRSESNPRSPQERGALLKGLESALFADRGERRQHRERVDIGQANRMLIEAFDDRPGPSWRTTAWPLAGGVEHWREQIRGELQVATSSASPPSVW